MSRRHKVRVFWRAACNAALERSNLSVSAAVAASGLLLQASPLLMLGFGSYILSVAADLRHPATWRRAMVELRCERPSLPSANHYRNAAAREFLARLQHARDEREVFCRPDATPSGTKVAELAERAAAVEKEAIGAMALLDNLAVYLGDHALEPLRSERARLDRLANEAPSKVASEQYAQARATIEQRQQALERIETWRTFVQSRLENMVGLLETLPVVLMKIEIWSTSASLAESKESPAQRLSDEMRTLEESSLMAMSLVDEGDSRGSGSC